MRQRWCAGCGEAKRRRPEGPREARDRRFEEEEGGRASGGRGGAGGGAPKKRRSLKELAKIEIGRKKKADEVEPAAVMAAPPHAAEALPPEALPESLRPRAGGAEFAPGRRWTSSTPWQRRTGPDHEPVVELEPVSTSAEPSVELEQRARRVRAVRARAGGGEPDRARAGGGDRTRARRWRSSPSPPWRSSPSPWRERRTRRSTPTPRPERDELATPVEPEPFATSRDASPAASPIRGRSSASPQPSTSAAWRWTRRAGADESAVLPEPSP